MHCIFVKSFQVYLLDEVIDLDTRYGAQVQSKLNYKIFKIQIRQLSDTIDMMKNPSGKDKKSSAWSCMDFMLISSPIKEIKTEESIRIKHIDCEQVWQWFIVYEHGNRNKLLKWLTRLVLYVMLYKLYVMFKYHWYRKY